MKVGTQVSILFIASFIFTLVFSGTAASDDSTRKKRSASLFSIETTIGFCKSVQQIIASTTLESRNIVHNSWDSFIESSPAPYAGENVAAYNGPADSGETLSLTTHEFITLAKLPRAHRQFPQVISCKMKSSEAIQRFIGMEASLGKLACEDVNRQTVSDVFASFTKKEKKKLEFNENQIVFEPDVVARSGPEWLDPSSLDVAFVGDDGRLHIESTTLLVPVDIDLPPPLALGEDKKGVQYCHLPSPAYIRLIAKGRIRP